MTKRSQKQRYPQPVPAESMGQPVKIKHQIKPKNYTQELYLESLREQPLTICAGPAGSGKTYLVTAVALEKLIGNEVDRVVITRPVVEAGEHLGFLPGTLEEKLDPYLLPLMDAIEDHVGPMMAKKLMESGKIEIAPLAFMRGRTFNNCLPADHLVLLADGKYIRMDDLLERFSKGEKLEVLSYNIETSVLESKCVQTAFKQPNNFGKLVKLTLENGTVLSATPDHKLFTQRGYVAVKDLTVEDTILSLKDELTEKYYARITHAEYVDSTEDVYDIMVEDNHNFFTNGGALSSNCFVILDESQNSTVSQMKMFVTRMGYDSQFAINGDMSQSDLQKPRDAGADWENGLQFIIRKLKGRDEKINYIEFQNRDVVRSHMVQRILNLLDSPDPKRTDKNKD